MSLANENFKQNCESSNLSIDSICLNIQDKMGELNQLNFLKDNKNAKEQIIKFLEDENTGKDLFYNKTLARLKSKDANFQTQFILEQKLEACQSLYPVEGPPTQQEISNKAIKARLVENLNQNFEDKAGERHSNAKRDIKELLKNNPAISKVLKSREKTFESSTKVSAGSDVAPINKLDSKAGNSPSENTKMDKKQNDFTKIKTAINSSRAIPSEPSLPRSDIEAGMETEFLNKKLKAKIADLEKKEKESIATKKQSQSNLIDRDKDKDKENIKDETPAIVDSAKAKRLEDLEALKKQVSALKSDNEKSNAIENNKLPVVAATNKNNVPTDPSALFGKNSAKDSIEESSIKSDFAKKTQEASNSFANSNFNQLAQDTSAKSVSKESKPGLVLTKSESISLKNSAILENPKESEIENLIKENQGRPVVIMENGILMEVALIINADKKRVFVKKALNKDKIAILAKEININKVAKDVSREPTRLYNLKSLIHEKVK